jgi:hypothetical protein
MRFLQLLVLTLILAVSASAQIPNSGFESWTSGEPDGWTTNNSAPTLVPITQSSTSHSGSSSARGEVLDVDFGFGYAPILDAGTDAAGFPLSTRPGSLGGFQQFSPIGGDRLFITCILFKGGISGTEVGGGAIVISIAASSFTAFSVPINYVNAETPDTAAISIVILGPASGSPIAHVGSFFLVDDLAFGGAVGVENDKPGIPDAFRLDQNYPNPFNPSTVIDYELAAGSVVTLKVYNVIGQEVATLVNDMMPAGRHQARWNASGLPSGVYTYRLTAQGDAGSTPISLSGRMILAK